MEHAYIYVQYTGWYYSQETTIYINGIKMPVFFSEWGLWTCQKLVSATDRIQVT